MRHGSFRSKGGRRCRPKYGSGRVTHEGVGRATTLVVETGTYNTKGTVGTNIATRRLRGIPQSEALRVVERFTPLDEDTIGYEVTIDDPSAFVRPWTVSMPLNRFPNYRVFEYACHEGRFLTQMCARSSPRQVGHCSGKTLRMCSCPVRNGAVVGRSIDGRLRGPRSWWGACSAAA